MLRSTALTALLLAAPTFAADGERTDPTAAFAAEGKVIKVSAQSSDDGVDWAEVTFKVTRCIAGPCTVHESTKVLIPFSQWRGRHGETMGIVRYEWKDKHGGPRAWALGFRFDQADEKERFEDDSAQAVANVGAPWSDSAVATR